MFSAKLNIFHIATYSLCSHLNCCSILIEINWIGPILAWLNRARIYNNEILASIIDKKPEHIPLLTLSNHHSCFDDPGIWGECLAVN